MERQAERSESTFQGMESMLAVPSMVADGRFDVDDSHRGGLSTSQQDRLVALGQVASGVAHDFNNLLCVIGQFADSMIRHGDRVERERLAALIRATVDRGAVLTRKLVTFAGPNGSTVRSLPLDEALDGLEDLVRYAVPAHVRLEYDRVVRPWTVRVEADALQLAILNLVINSRDSMPDGGTLKVSAHAITVTRERSVSLKVAAGEYVEIRVVDTGCGMSPEVLAQCFVRDFTTKPPIRGSGLGLHQVASFARDIDGVVEARSVEGIGTTVSIYLPRVALPSR
jgi:signal transduction histidine kinase